MHDIRDMEANAAREAAKPKNRYDASDVVRRVFLMNAEGLKFASYRVRDMAALFARNEEKFSTLQHHLTYVPVQSFGGTMLVNEIGATVYATLDDEQTRFLAEVVEKIEAGGDEFDAMAFLDLEKTKVVIQAYRRPGQDLVELQVLRGDHVLGLLSIKMAKMFVLLAGRARDGVPSLADQVPPDVSPADAIAGEVDAALKAPMQEIKASDLDGVA